MALGILKQDPLYTPYSIYIRGDYILSLKALKDLMVAFWGSPGALDSGTEKGTRTWKLFFW